jgi:hypothetical protein
MVAAGGVLPAGLQSPLEEKPMVSLTGLWLPILVSAVMVFITSSVIWMLLPYHRTDWKKLPNEEAAMNTLRDQGIAPGMYVFPHAMGEDLKAEDVRARFQRGPVGFLMVRPTEGALSMGSNLIQAFIFYVVVSFFVAYLGSATLPMGTDYLKVFQVTGASAFMAYGMANVVNAIWFGVSWSFVAKSFFDALVYGCVTAGVFGSMWPT